MKKLNCEGYVIIAGNDQHYLEMAANTACSLKLNDPNRPIALLIFGGLTVHRNYFCLFDHVVAFDPQENLLGAFTKSFYLDKYTPFERSIYVDSDCFLISKNVNSLWDLCRGKHFATMGHVVNSGIHYRCIDVEKIIKCGLCDQVILTNVGVFYFESNNSNIVMNECRLLLTAHNDKTLPVPITYYAKPGELSDEPIWGIAIARSGMDGVIEPDYSLLFQATTPNATEFFFDFENGIFTFTKNGLKNVSGYFAHFCALQPTKQYIEGVIYYRKYLKIPLPIIYYEGIKVSCEDFQKNYSSMDFLKEWKFLDLLDVFD